MHGSPTVAPAGERQPGPAIAAQSRGRSDVVMRHPFKVLLLASTLAIGLPVVVSAADRAEISDLPAPAQQTLQQFLEGGQVTKLEKSVKNNTPIYQAEVKKPDGSRTTLQVAPDGKLIELKRH
jgi:hypothetical protein